MSRLLVPLIIALVVIVGALFFLAGRNSEKTPVHVEKVVPLADLQK